MADTKLTLQDRINMLIIVSSILFISALTFIQLNNQLNNLTQFNTYQANLSSIIVKNNLETVIRQIPKKDLTAYLQSSLNTLVETMIIKDAYIFDKKGTVIASTTSSLTGNTVRYKDLSKLSDLEYLLQKEKWFITDIDEKNRRLDIYLTLRANSQQPIEYVAKISFSLGNIQEALLGVYQPVIIATIIIVLANILLGYLLFKTVVGPIKLLNKVTKMIADGNLSVRANIRTNDELQELGSTFNYMTEELVKMKERAENANPLTKLPGNIVIREQIEKQIREKLKFVVIYCDLDNFKAFNDKYGIARGDEAIKLTAEIFKEAISGKGNPEDFIGHEGGDDFILITTPG
jgi:GGDEF domain-containing protein